MLDDSGYLERWAFRVSPTSYGGWWDTQDNGWVVTGHGGLHPEQQIDIVEYAGVGGAAMGIPKYGPIRPWVELVFGHENPAVVAAAVDTLLTNSGISDWGPPPFNQSMIRMWPYGEVHPRIIKPAYRTDSSVTWSHGGRIAKVRIDWITFAEYWETDTDTEREAPNRSTSSMPAR